MTASPSARPDPVPPRPLHEEEIGSYHRDGYLVLRGLLPRPTAEALRAEVMAIMDAIGLPVTSLRQTEAYLRGSRLDAFVNSPNLRDLAARLVGGPASVYMPFTAVKSPGGAGFSFHQDNQYTRLDGPACNIWTALMPMGEIEGSLQVLPASHRQGTLAAMTSEDGSGQRRVTFTVADFIQPTLAAGDAIAFSRLTVHGSGANRSPLPRVAYAVQYHRDDVRALFDGSWELLTIRPRWATGPVEQIAPPSGQKKDGH